MSEHRADQDPALAVARFEAALDVFDERLHQVPDDSWSAATPCADWDVRALVNHVVGEQAWVPPLMAGRTVAEVADTLDGDLLGTDPCAAWHHHCGPAHAAFAAPGALAGTVALSYGPEQASAYCDQLTFDLVVHSWDLARGAGLDEELPDDLVGWGIDWASPILSSLTSSGMFGQPLSVPAGADRQTRLLAMVGRRR